MTALDRMAALADLLPRPLDPVRSVKLKVSILLLVSGGVGLGYLYLVYGWQPPIPHQLITVALVLLTAQVLGNGMTRPLREMTAAALAMAQRRLLAPDPGHLPGRGRAARRGVQPDGRRPGRGRPAASGADRQRVARAAHADRGPAGGAGEPGRRRGRAGPGDAADRARRRPSGSAGWSPSCSTCPGSTPARCRWTGSRCRWPTLLAETVAEAEVSAGVAGRSVEFAVDVQPAGLVVRADRARLHQVLVNLLDNAARHGPPGSVVSVVARAEGERLMIEVRDEGPGIAAGGPGAGVPPVHPRRAGGRRRYRAGAGHRPVGGRAARRADRGGRAAGRRDAGCRIRVTLPGSA